MRAYSYSPTIMYYNVPNFDLRPLPNSLQVLNYYLPTSVQKTSSLTAAVPMDKRKLHDQPTLRMDGLIMHPSKCFELPLTCLSLSSSPKFKMKINNTK